MQIIDDGIRLDAVIDMPRESKARCPMVIIIHGFTGNKEERHILAVSRMFNELGLATLRVDMYGHGESEGRFEDHTLFKWMTNAMTVIDYARKLDFVTDLYLCGHSQGGLTSILAAGLKHDVIKGLIPMSPATNIIDGARLGNLFGASFNPDRIPDTLTFPNGRTLGGNYFRVAQSIKVNDYIDRYRGPVFLVHGDADESVPVKCSVDASRRYKNAKLAVISGDTHCYDNHLFEVVSAIRGWMEDQLKD